MNYVIFRKQNLKYKHGVKKVRVMRQTVSNTQSEGKLVHTDYDTNSIIRNKTISTH